ncbi:MAG: nucleotidyl transferase AbiEii/AbiGii toxin family protein [Anaerolineae bacterium]|nr:nucleotidyl transferase AbiEii/AbiGii toxin family protein [Anaerolineae bacterium]
MFGADMLTLQEFVMQETLPLSTIHNAVLEFLRGRDDAVLFGAQAVNAYVSQPRMTQDIDLMSDRAEELAEEMREQLSQQFHIAVRVRQVAGGRGFRIYQVQKSGNRHLVDLHVVDNLPEAERIGQILVMSPAELIASKVIAYTRRQGKPKSGTDWRDIALLLLTFPKLKQTSGEVLERLKVAKADEQALSIWQQFATQEIRPEDEDEDF